MTAMSGSVPTAKVMAISSELVAHFYELLRADTSKVAALQAAQKRMLTDARYRHPSYWAPFLLIGNWL